MKSNLFRNMTAILLFILVLSAFSVLLVSAEDVIEIIAAWEYTAGPASAKIHATGGSLAEGAVLTSFKDAAPVYSSSGLSINNWDNGADKKYWQISMSTKGFKDITFFAKVSSSEEGPRDFKVNYSIDNGQSWRAVQGGEYTLSDAAFNSNTDTISLPPETENSSNLQIRLIMATNFSSHSNHEISIGMDAVRPSATSSINNIIVSGTPLYKGDYLSIKPVAALQEGDNLCGLRQIILSCEDEDAVIMYAINEEEYKEYDAYEKLLLSTLPASIKAYAVKEGRAGDISVYYYE